MVLPRSAFETVPWLKAATSSVECAAVPGVLGVQLVEAASLGADRTAFDAALRGVVGEPVTGNELWVDAARLLATSWPVPVSFTSETIKFTLPEGLRTAGQLPGRGGIVVAFCVGPLL